MDKRLHGFTLLDLLVAMVILVIVSGMAMPLYTAYVERANESQAITNIYEIQLALDRFNAQNFAYPDNLNELAGIPTVDPWGNAYSYLRIDGNNTPGLKGKQRKDKNLNPLNTDYDLFSSGEDGESKGPLTAKASRDDIVRAGNGGFIGRGEDH